LRSSSTRSKLYHGFSLSLSLRDVETILADRGIVVSYKSIRDRGLRFGLLFAKALRRRQPRCGDKWFENELFLPIGDKQHVLWRAVDWDGHVLDIRVQSRRHATVASGSFTSCCGACSVPDG
jgi:putative transposase